MSAVKASEKKWQKNKWREDEGKEARSGAAMRKPVNGQATERKAREADTMKDELTTRAAGGGFSQVNTGKRPPK